jgi:signal recognition particle subunit SRP19
MPSRKEGLQVLYPEYFDVELSREEGRKVPRNFAKHGPTAADVLKAAREADPELEPKLEGKSHFPSRWHERRGRVLVRKKHSKTKTLLMVAKKL